MRNADFQAFISYSRADWHDVESLVREFRNVGITTWVDIENMQPGDRWEPAIRGAIGSSRAFVFCISPLCVESGRTFKELETAISLGRLVFPVMIQPTPLDSLPEALRRHHILQFFRDPPPIASKRAARQLAQMLGLPLSDDATLVGNHETIDALILRIGDQADAPPATQFLDHASRENRAVVDRAVTPLDSANFLTIADWLNRSSVAYLVVGDDPAVDEIALTCGLAFAILGGRRLSFVCTPLSRSIASKFANLVQARLVECSTKSSAESR